jgi:predicted ATPase
VRDDLPGGSVTFLFTDVEGSTRLLHEFGAEGYAQALAEHRRVIREACAAEGGVEVDTQGDAFFFAFPTAAGATEAARAMTETLAPGPIQVRIGLHTGTPLLTEEGYVGVDVHFAARVAASGHGGQVILSQATAHVVELELTDLGEHRLKDIADAVSIFQLGTSSFPPLKTISNTNLPRPASSFVGREQEVADVLARIEAGARLVTLTGPGGSGKTRLALEASASLVPEYKAGVFWVGLAALRDPALVSETISQTLGAKNGLAEHIQERELLLLLDNLEQVIEAAPELAALLSACPGLTLLVTSRELLRVQGEVEYPVPPLAEPEAVALFCERSGLERSEEISELCARLDNLPLAVELAAARAKALSPTQILERLSQRLDLLSGGRDSDPRQQTLRATIEWSYDLLSDAEQHLFGRLSVFAGGCTLEAAEEITDADLDTLQSLVEKSLLRFSNERYWMLETIREYARERLERQGGAYELRQRHAEWVLVFSRDAEAGLQGPDAGAWVTRLDLEMANIRDSLDWAVVDHPELVLGVGAALWWFWPRRGHAAEPTRWIEGAWSDDVGVELRMRALRALAAIAETASDIPRLAAASEERLRLARETGDAAHEAGALHMLAVAAQLEADLPRAKRLYGQALALHQAAGDPVKASIQLGSMGLIARDEGDLLEARMLLSEYLAMSRAIGDQWEIAWALQNLGWVAAQQGAYDEASENLREGFKVAMAVGKLDSVPVLLGAVADLALRTERAQDAAVFVGAAESQLDSLGATDFVSDKYWSELLDHVREAVGSGEFEVRYASGRSLELEKAVRLAVACLD